MSVPLKPTWSHGLQLTARLALAAVFVAAALPKLADPAAFATSIDNYRLLPSALVGPLAVGLPVLELVVALGLLSRSHLRGAALLSALMLGAFALAMAQAKLRGIDLDCGCFGTAARSPVSWWKVLANATGTAVAAWLCFSRRAAWPPEPRAARNMMEGPA